MDYQKNTSYIFVPFIFEKHDDFRKLNTVFSESKVWSPIQDEVMYMLKYVADKMNSRDREHCQCFHYELNEYARKTVGLEDSQEWYTTESHIYKGREEEFQFQIMSAHLYCFSTTVGIVAFRIHLEKDDPIWVSSAQYHLKKASREKIRAVDNQDQTGSFTFLDLSKRLVAEGESVTKFDFFYYANPSTERSNVLTYLEVEPKENYRYELFYLRRCYNEGFTYTENEQLDSEEIYIPSPDTVWGISPEAAVCLVCTDKGRAEFLQGRFYKNFNAQYFFMYIMLLHQKYALYMFLTKVGVGANNDLQMLEDYRQQLYEFETDFVFSCVAEVPQYQNLYERMTTAFSLRKMYEDVHEPLVSLSEMRHVALENQKQKRDSNMNKALITLSILSLFSALMDSFSFVESFCGWFLGEDVVKIIQSLVIVAISVAVLSVLYKLIKSNKD